MADAQEEVKTAILGKKDKNGKRPINPRLNLGKHGFLFIINSKGLEIAHPNFEGENVWNIKTVDGVYSTKEIVLSVISSSKSSGRKPDSCKIP